MKIRDQSRLISLERLKYLITYCPVTGQFTANVARCHVRIGQLLGTVHHTGYHHIGIDGQTYQASRLAWFYMTGKWPPYILDHKDTDRGNNIWENLREATDSQNCSNRVAMQNNKAQEKGIYYRHRKPWKPVWVAQIKYNGKVIHLGHFKQKEDAAAAYQRAAVKYHGEFARF